MGGVCSYKLLMNLYDQELMGDTMLSIQSLLWGKTPLLPTAVGCQQLNILAPSHKSFTCMYENQRTHVEVRLEEPDKLTMSCSVTKVACFT